MKRRKQIKSHVRSASYLCSHIKLNRPKMNRALSLGKIGALGLAVLLGTSCNKESVCDEETIPQEEENGKQMLLIGNSFFRPYAENLDIVAADAGYADHSSTTVFRGGDNGRAGNFWDDSTSQETMNIKAALDAGDIELFAMTADGDTADPTRGYKAWINYALQNNPDIEIGISLPMIDFPANWDSTAQALGYNDIHDLYPFVIDQFWHTNVIDSLRVEFPDVNIFSIPTGWAGIKLAQMQQDDLLDDDIDLFGAKPTSIFTDQMGHQGQIVI